MKSIVLAIVLLLGVTSVAEAHGPFARGAYNRGYYQGYNRGYNQSYYNRYDGYQIHRIPAYNYNSYQIYNPYLYNGGVGYGTWYYYNTPRYRYYYEYGY